jgi:hypothetical protein
VEGVVEVEDEEEVEEDEEVRLKSLCRRDLGCSTLRRVSRRGERGNGEGAHL